MALSSKDAGTVSSAIMSPRNIHTDWFLPKSVDPQLQPRVFGINDRYPSANARSTPLETLSELARGAL